MQMNCQKNETPMELISSGPLAVCVNYDLICSFRKKMPHRKVGRVHRVEYLGADG